MPRLKLLTDVQQKKYDDSPIFKIKQRERYFALEGRLLDYIEALRSPLKQVGFVIQVAYFRASGKFFASELFRKADIKYACQMLDIEFDDVNSWDWTMYDRQTIAKHRQHIRKFYGWVKFSVQQREELIDELSVHAKQHSYPEQLLPIAAKYLVNRKIELPAYSTIQQIITDIYNRMEKDFISIINASLSKGQKTILDDLILIDDEKSKNYKYSALSKIKHLPTSTKIKDIENTMQDYKLLKAFYLEFTKVYAKLKLPEKACKYFSQWVTKSRLFQLKQFTNREKAYLYLLGHINHQFFKHTDCLINIFLKLVGAGKNKIENNIKKMNANLTKEQKIQLEKLINNYRGSKSVFWEILGILNDNDSVNKELKIRELIVNHLGATYTASSDVDLDKLESLQSKKEEELSKLHSQLATSLQRKLTPIIIELDLECCGRSISWNAIQLFKDYDGQLSNIKESERSSLIKSLHVSSKKKTTLTSLKGLVYSKIFDEIKSGKLNARYSFEFLPIQDYLISDGRWQKEKSLLLSSTGLEKYVNLNNVLANLNYVLKNRFNLVNEDYINGLNKHLKFKKDNNFTISTPANHIMLSTYGDKTCNYEAFS